MPAELPSTEQIVTETSRLVPLCTIRKESVSRPDILDVKKQLLSSLPNSLICAKLVHSSNRLNSCFLSVLVKTGCKHHVYVEGDKGSELRSGGDRIKKALHFLQTNNIRLKCLFSVMRYFVHKPLQATGTVESRSVSNHRFLKPPEFSNQFSFPLDILLSNGLNFTLDFSNPLISR